MLVDANVLSQMTRRSGDAEVIAWIDRHFDRLLVPAVVASELLFGAHKLADAAQRNQLVPATDALLLRCAGKFVSFDIADATLRGCLMGEAARLGHTRPSGDTMIAAMAVNRGLAVATRNVRHFQGLDLEIINPWKA